jgi:galactose mutarotase-like enzyme
MLHGGVDGWDSKIWTVGATNPDCVEFRLEDESAGYPCIISVRVVYTVSEGQVKIECAVTNEGMEDTIVNPTCHTYFNLTGFHEMGLASHLLSVPGMIICNLKVRLGDLRLMRIKCRLA